MHSAGNPTLEETKIFESCAGEDEGEKNRPKTRLWLEYIVCETPTIVNANPIKSAERLLGEQC